MNHEKSNGMVLKNKNKNENDETNNRWKGEGEELQTERFRMSGEREPRVPGSCPRPEFQPRLCWVVCLRCSWVPPDMQAKCHSHSWVSAFSTLLSPPARSVTPPAVPLGRGSLGCQPADMVRWCLQHSSSWYICSSSSWDSRCSRRSVRPLMISSGVFINLNKSLCPGSFLIMFSL